MAKRRRRKWLAYFSFANIISATAIIISICAWLTTDRGVQIQQKEYQTNHRPHLELTTYASRGTDSILKGTLKILLILDNESGQC